MAAKAPAVLIINPTWDYVKMFQDRGWIIADALVNADLVQFTGGEDVTPSLYGHGIHKKTSFNKARDKKEELVFRLAKGEVPMAGICRGGQFLNVMCGGTMYQHVDRHSGVGHHEAIDMDTGENFQVTSTHHQMMNPTKDGQLVMIAREATFRETSRTPGGTEWRLTRGTDVDVEAVYYEKQNCFCFQPHPEFPREKDLAERYFGYLQKFCRVG